MGCIPLKKRKKYFTTKKKKKLQFLFGTAIAAFIILNGTIVWIQNVKGEEYGKKVLSQQNFANKTIPFRRGDIKDSNGNILATSQKVYNMILDCKQLNSLGKDYIDATVKAMAECFPEYDESTLRQILKDKKKSSYTVLQKKMTYEQIQAFVELSEDEKKGKNIAGVWFEDEYQRTYPGGTLACDIIGFTYQGSIGNCGIEKSYNDVLNGENGKEYGYLNLDSGQEKVVKNATDGNTVVTTIDSNIQKIAEKYILEFNEEHRNEAREGAGSLNTGVIIQNPNTGEILAEASYPVFDLNQPYDTSTAGVTAADIAQIQAKQAQEIEQKRQAGEEVDETKLSDATTEALSAVWRNYCVNDTFEPGSTAKTLTIATGIETGTLTGDETYVCDGVEVVGDRTIHCVNRSGHGTENTAQALMYSCNDALMQMSYKIGIDNFTKYQSIFGIGRKTTIDLPAEPNTSQLLYTRENMKPVDLATSSFGQTFNVTMTQMMSAFCSVVNGGYYYQPHVVKRIESPSGTTVKTIEPVLMRQTISKETSDIMKGYLKEVCMNGTAKTAVVPGYSMGGKTGTAEKVENGQRKKKCYVVSFIGCVPADNPELAIYVTIDEPNVADQAHSSYAQEIARKILAEVLPYMNIYPDDETAAAQQEETQPQDSVQPAEDSTQPSEGAQPAGEDPQPSDVGQTGQQYEPGAGDDSVFE